MLRRMRCNLIFAILAITRLTEVDNDATGVRWFPLMYDQSEFILVCAVPGVTQKRSN